MDRNRKPKASPSGYSSLRHISEVADVPVAVTEVRKLRRASGALRNGVIEISVPMCWRKQDKLDAIQSLINRILRKKKQEEALLNRDLGPLMTLETPAALEEYVRRLNAETFNVPLAKVRVGSSRYSQLAQMNIKTKTMTVSRYCLKGVPVEALRYLIVHELAHLLEASHNKRFWTLVTRHCPDYKKQSRIIRAVHHAMVENTGSAIPKGTPAQTIAAERTGARPREEMPRHAGTPASAQQLSLF